MEIITTGEEVLQGQIVDRNAAWLSQQLYDHGLFIQRRSTVGDRMDDLVALFQQAAQRNRLVIVNGGLGPTQDDLTARAAAQAAGLPLVEHQGWLQQLQHRLEQQGAELRPSHRQQARLPQGVEIIPNPVGSACGFWLNIDSALFCFTPGPPSELKPMFGQYILPRLLQQFGDGSRNLLTRLQVFGCSEASVEQQLHDLSLPENTRLGFRPHLPTLEVKIMSRGREPDLDQQHEHAVQLVRQRVGSFIYGEDDQQLHGVLHQALLAGSHSLALAESCTAGWACGELARQPGSSAWLKQAWVTYSAEAKCQELGVPESIIRQHGVISIPVAEVMATGARQRANTTLALAITGQSGPVADDDPIPAGTACIALAHEQGVLSAGWQHRDFGRNANRTVQVWLLLDLLRRHLFGLDPRPSYDLCRQWP